MKKVINLATVSPVKMYRNLGGVPPTLSSLDKVAVGDFVIDNSTVPYTVWKCIDNTPSLTVYKLNDGDMRCTTPVVDGDFPVFDGDSGHLVKDTGFNPSSFDVAGSAATVQGHLTTHQNLTGTSVHGLGTASTHAETDFDLAGSASAAIVSHESLYNHLKYNSVFSTVENGSANWDNARQTLVSSSGNWESVHSTVESNSGNWNNARSTLESLSSNWESVFSTVDDNSGNWETARSTLESNSGDWENATTSYVSNSGNFVTLNTPQTINASKTINGNVKVNGVFSATSAIFIYTEQLELSSNFIELNSNATSALSGEDAGIRVHRGSIPPAELRWNGVDARWEGGLTGDLKPIAYTDIVDGINSTVRSHSGDWESVLSTVQSNSANWDDTRSTLSSNSGNWDDTRSTLESNSANWDDTRSTLSSNSGNWDDVRSNVSSNSGNWESVLSTVQSNSANWDDTRSTLSSNSGNWDSVYSTVDSNSTNWDNTRSTLESNSGNWDSTYSTLQANSAIWGAAASGAYVTLSGNQNIHGLKTFFGGISSPRSDVISHNEVIGAEAGLNFNVSGSVAADNCAFGYQALKMNTEGQQNCAMGGLALTKNTQGYSNVAIGNFAMENNLEGGSNVALGCTAMRANIAGDSNVAIGDNCLAGNLVGSYNTAIGSDTMSSILSGDYNIAIGNSAFNYNDNGSYNIAIGVNSLYSNVTGSNLVAIGNMAGGYETGSDKFYLDNFDRNDYDSGVSGSMFYGEFNLDPSLQTLRINANLTVPYGVTADLSGNAATATKSTNLIGGVLGSVPYQSNVDTTLYVSPNLTATKKFLSQTGTGSVGAAPVWGTISYSDTGAEPANANIQSHITNSTTAHGLTIANVTTQGNSFNGSGQLVKLSADLVPKLPAVDGSLLINLPSAGTIGGSTGAVDKAILRANGAGGVTLQNSLATIDDNGTVNIPAGQSYKVGGVALSSSGMTFNITYAGHGLAIGALSPVVPISRIGTGYGKAKADTAVNIEVVGVAIEAVDASTLKIQQGGQLTRVSHGYTGPVVFVDPANAGLLTEDASLTAGTYRKPILKVLGTDTLEVIDVVAVEVASNSSYPVSFTNANLTAGVLTVNHQLGQQVLQWSLTNDLNQVCAPTNLTWTDVNTCSLDVSGFGVISGTWNLLLSRGGFGGRPQGGAGLSMSWSIITNNALATDLMGYMIDATSNTVTLTLPALPVMGTQVGFRALSIDNTVTIAANGNKIEGVAADLVIDVANTGTVLVYSNSTYGWVAITN